MTEELIISVFSGVWVSIIFGLFFGFILGMIFHVIALFK